MRSIPLDGDADNPSTPLSIAYMRRKGLPWLTAAIAILVVVLIVLLFILLMRELGRTSSSTAERCEELGGNVTLKESEGGLLEVGPVGGTAVGGTTSRSSLSRTDWPFPNDRTMLGRFKNAAIACDNAVCGEVGRGILLRGGNAVDAAIAVLTCVGALNSHSSGLGGGFILTFYNRKERRCMTVNARETAPLTAHADRYAANPNDAVFGYKSIAVPGELHGMWTSFKRFGSGRIAWQDLIMPTVHILNSGYSVSKLMEIVLQYHHDRINENSDMKGAFTNPSTGELYKEGETIRNFELAETLRRLAISPDPVRLFYRGDMAHEIDEEMRENGGFLSMKDLIMFESSVDESPLHSDDALDGLSLCGPAPPASFHIAQLIVALTARFYRNDFDVESLYKSAEFYHRFIEAQKFAFAEKNNFGDIGFVPEAHLKAVNMTSSHYIDYLASLIEDSANEATDYGYPAGTYKPDDGGTSHVSVVDSYGNAVSVSSSINKGFGSLRRSEKLGVIWNNHMADFSLPKREAVNLAPAPEGHTDDASVISKRSADAWRLAAEPNEASANSIEPRKRPMSCMCPTIVYSKADGEVKMAIGGAGGVKIIPAVAYVILRSLLFNETLKEAIDAPRIYTFDPLKSNLENGFPKEIMAELEFRGQSLTKAKPPDSAVQGIVRDASGYLTVNNDYRRLIHMHPTGI